MGLLDSYNTPEKTIPFPENDFEKLLVEASSKPKKRKQFYDALLETEFVVLTVEQITALPTEVQFKADTQLQLVTLKNGSIPMFSAVNRIFDRAVMQGQVNVLALKAKDIFNMVKGQTIALNPFSDYGKMFSPEEIIKIMDGTVLTGQNDIALRQYTEIKLGQPEVYPQALVDALKEVLVNNDKIKDAYLGAALMNHLETSAHLVIAMEAGDDFQEVAKELGPVAEKFIPKGQIIDFIKLEKETEIGKYFIEKTTPFFSQS